ncbi:MAG: response regulator transcription factor [Flavobacteriales bacterium]|nr:MAG: response regulator transcription factor [Flavobacteriales bacterium]
MISISIVEDHENYRTSLVKAIEAHDRFKVIGVYSSAEEAMTELINNPPDIAILDIKLERISGIELIEQVKAKIPDTQFLMCTSFQNDENVFNALKAGALGYIVKGSTSLDIQTAIIELYEGGSPMTPYIARKVISFHHKQPAASNFGLSQREIEVLSLLSKGLMYKEISSQLEISQNTVKNHCKNIYKRLHVQNKVEALNKFKNL